MASDGASKPSWMGDYSIGQVSSVLAGKNVVKSSSKPLKTSDKNIAKSPSKPLKTSDKNIAKSPLATIFDKKAGRDMKKKKMDTGDIVNSSSKPLKTSNKNIAKSPMATIVDKKAGRDKKKKKRDTGGAVARLKKKKSKQEAPSEETGQESADVSKPTGSGKQKKTLPNKTTGSKHVFFGDEDESFTRTKPTSQPTLKANKGKPKLNNKQSLPESGRTSQKSDFKTGQSKNHVYFGDGDSNKVLPTQPNKKGKKSEKTLFGDTDGDGKKEKRFKVKRNRKKGKGGDKSGTKANTSSTTEASADTGSDILNIDSGLATVRLEKRSITSSQERDTVKKKNKKNAKRSKGDKKVESGNGAISPGEPLTAGSKSESGASKMENPSQQQGVPQGKSKKVLTERQAAKKLKKKLIWKQKKRDKKEGKLTGTKEANTEGSIDNKNRKRKLPTEEVVGTVKVYDSSLIKQSETKKLKTSPHDAENNTNTPKTGKKKNRRSRRKSTQTPKKEQSVLDSPPEETKVTKSIASQSAPSTLGRDNGTIATTKATPQSGRGKKRALKRNIKDDQNGESIRAVTGEDDAPEEDEDSDGEESMDETDSDSEEEESVVDSHGDESIDEADSDSEEESVDSDDSDNDELPKRRLLDILIEKQRTSVGSRGDHAEDGSENDSSEEEMEEESGSDSDGGGHDTDDYSDESDDESDDDNDDDDLINKDDDEIDEVLNQYESEIVELISRPSSRRIDGDSINDNLDAEEEGKTLQKSKTVHDPEVIKRTIFVGNLPTDTTKQDLKDLFKKYGIIESMRFRSGARADPKISQKVAMITKQLHPERSSYNAYVVFKSPESAQQALSRNGKVHKRHHIRVDLVSNSKKHNTKHSVFVGNLPFDIDVEPVLNHFMQCGEVEGVRLIRDKATGLGKGIGYVLLKDSSAVALALKLDGSSLVGRSIRVERAMKMDTLRKQQDHKTIRQKRGGKNRGIKGNKDVKVKGQGNKDAKVKGKGDKDRDPQKKRRLDPKVLQKKQKRLRYKKKLKAKGDAGKMVTNAQKKKKKVTTKPKGKKKTKKSK